MNNVVQLPDSRVCPKCEGTGQYGKYGECYRCGGTGRIVATPPRTGHEVDASKIKLAFDTAIENGIKRPKLGFDHYAFALAPETGKNPGAIYVSYKVKGESPVYLGKIKDNTFYPSADCNGEHMSALVDVIANPAEQAKAYGRRTGTCSVCGRGLTNHASIDAGIGPICAGKMGW